MMKPAGTLAAGTSAAGTLAFEISETISITSGALAF